MGSETEEQMALDVAALVARGMDSGLAIPGRIAVLRTLCPLLSAASHAGESGAAVADKLIDMKFLDFAMVGGLVDASAYIGLGELKGCADVAQAAAFICARMATVMALMDGWGSRSHPEWRHQWFNAVYGAIPVSGRRIAELLARGEGTTSDVFAHRTEEMATAIHAESDGGLTVLSVLPTLLRPHGLGGAAARVIVTGGLYEATSTSLREDPLDSCKMYAHAICASMSTPFAMADAGLTSRLFESGIIEAGVARVQRAQTADTPVHVNVNRCMSQLMAAVATTAEGRAKLNATAGLEDALTWLLEHGGDPIGIAEHKTLADPRGMAGLCLALLRGREEDAQLALPAKVIHQIVAMIDTYYQIGGAAMVLPYVQGLAEVSVSDANKEHLVSTPGVIDSLRTCLEITSTGSDPNTVQLRTFSCSALAQLSACDLTLPLLLGHPILEDLEQIPSLPESSKDARNDAIAALFAVRQHEKAEAAPVAASPTTTRENAGHIMLSYEWSVQPVIVRIRDSLVKRSYRVWLDIDQMRGSTMDAMSDAVDEAAVVCFGVSAAYKESSNCRLEAQYAHQTGVDMIPMMMENPEKKIRGWLGMILGTRLWYGFFGSEKDDDAALDRQVEAMCRELGDRGKAGAQQVSDRRPPCAQKPDPAPHPALTPAPAPAPASTPPGFTAKDATPALSTSALGPTAPGQASAVITTAAATAPQTMHQPPSSPKPATRDDGDGEPRGSFVDIIAFMREEREHMRQIMLDSEKQRQRQQQEYEKIIEQLKERPKPAVEVIDEGQLAALQTRLQSLHEANLLADEELFALEDLIVDCIEVMPLASASLPTVEKVARMLLVASKVGDDGMLARQLRRKFM